VVRPILSRISPLPPALTARVLSRTERLFAARTLLLCLAVALQIRQPWPASANGHRIQAVDERKDPALAARTTRKSPYCLNSFFWRAEPPVGRRSQASPSTTLCPPPTHATTHPAHKPNPPTGGREALRQIPSKSVGFKGLAGVLLRPRRGELASIPLVLLRQALLPNASRPRLHRIRPCSTSSNQSPLPFTSTHTYIHRVTMAEPWLGAYQNVDASDAYLTPHQREALQHFRAEQGSGFRFRVRQHWERLSGEKRREARWIGWAGHSGRGRRGSGGLGF